MSQLDQHIIDRLEFAWGYEDDVNGQQYELWWDPETELEYWVPVDKVYRWTLIQPVNPTQS